MASVHMSRIHKKAIQKTATLLLESLNPTVATYLHTSEIFTDLDVQNINGQGTRADKVSKIIEILKMKKDEAFDAFCDALRETEQDFLVIALKRNLSEPETEPTGASTPATERKRRRDSPKDVEKSKKQKVSSPAKERKCKQEENAGEDEVLTGKKDGLVAVAVQKVFSNAVCRIKTKKGTGSGFYAKVRVKGADVCGVFTCNHVLGEKQDAEDAEVFFHYDKPGQGDRISLKPDTLFKTNKDLDYSLVGVDRDEMDALGLNPVEFIKEPKVSKGNHVYIYQHPEGRPKEFSNDKIKSVQPPFVYYEADTQSGSSGSPVIYKSSLLAVHQKGSGTLQHNRGTLCSEILSDLRNETYTKPKGYQPSDDETDGDPEIRWREGKTTENELRKLGEKLPGDWKRLGSELGLDDSRIQAIARDYVNYGDIPEKAFQVLMLWKGSKPNPTYRTLGEALKAIDKYRLAEEFCGETNDV